MVLVLALILAFSAVSALRHFFKKHSGIVAAGNEREVLFVPGDRVKADTCDYDDIEDL